MPDVGYFPAGESILRRVHEERAVGLLYGQRALLMQATHPVAFTGLVGETGGLDAPFKRLARTAQIMGAVYFGSCGGGGRGAARGRELPAPGGGATDRAPRPHPAGAPRARGRP